MSDWDAGTQGYLLGTTVAHEFGHEMGLQHERSQPTAGGPITEYYTGVVGGTRPIMGDATSGGYTSRGIWYKTNAIQTQQLSPDPVQDEVAIITSVLGNRPDGQTTASPGTLTLFQDGEFTPTSGVIEKINDTDPYVFTPTTSRVTFTVSNAGDVGMLIPTVTIIRKSDGAAIPADFTSNGGSCTVSCSTLVPNTAYELVVGNDSSYGSLGQYSISGSQQQFAVYDSDDRFVNIGGFDGNNNITISVVASSPTNQFDPGQLLITDSVNGGTTQSNSFSMSGMNLIYITLGGGNDPVTINPTAALNGQSFHPGVQFDGGGGSNALILSKGSAASADFSVNSSVEISFATTDVVFHNVQAIDLVGNSSTTNYYINDWEDVCPLTLIGGTGIDNFYIEPQVTNSLGSEIEADGGGGTGANTLTWDSSTVTQAKTFNVFDGEITSQVNLPAGEGGSGGGGQRDVDFSGITTLVVNGTALADAMTVYSLASTTTLMFHSGDGNDEVTLGDSSDNLDLSYVAGSVYFYGDGGTNYGYLDDASSTTAHQYVGDHTHVGTTVGGNLYNVNDSVQYLTIDGGDTNGSLYTIYEGQPGVTLILNGGAGNDSFNFDNATTWNSYMYGNGGFNTLTVDDRSGASAPFRTTIDDHSVSHYYGTASSFTGYTIYYSNIGSATYYGAPTTNLLNVLSTSSDIASGYQWTAVMNTGNDTINVYPHNTVTGAATILSALGIIGGGGTDTINIDDSADPTAVSYDFYNPFGSGQFNLTGSGLGLGAAGMQTINMMGGAGNDYYRIDTFETGGALNIYGNGGNDTLDITPSSANAMANLTSPPTIDFVGGAGSDTMRFYNDNGTTALSYIQNSNYFEAYNSSATWIALMYNSQVETIYASGSTQADTIVVDSMAAGSTFQVTGGAGLDNVSISAGPVEFPTSQDFNTLSIGAGATAKMTGSRTGLLVRSTFSVNGRLDLNSSDLAVDYTGASPIGAWNGTNYTGMTGLIRSGRNGGGWNGSTGIVTSGSNANTTLGINEASASLHLSGAQTAAWHGYTVDATTALIRYTYAGDENLDGVINGDDYFNIDSGFHAHSTGYANGDLNYDGRIDADDYFLIDSDYGHAKVAMGLVVEAAPAGAELPRVKIGQVDSEDEADDVWDDFKAI